MTSSAQFTLRIPSTVGYWHTAWRMPLLPTWYPIFAQMLLSASAVASIGTTAPRGQAIDNLLAGRFNWMISSPLVSPVGRLNDVTYSVKDPSIVHYQGKWHLFCTIRGQKRSHQIEYLCFEDWNDIDSAKRYVMKLSDGYFCAPQVFYFTPHKKWYLICQVIEKSRKPALQPAFSTTSNINDPYSWSKPELLFAKQPENVKMWIDFWVICDDTRAHLFFTSLDGRMWRSEAKLTEFPHGWSQPSVVLNGDIFEASHTYRLKEMNKFLTIIEAQAGGRRYYKAYIAEALDKQWVPLAATKEKPFAGPANTSHTGKHWTDSFSHGELIRAGFDQELLVDPAELRFLFQGVSDQEKEGKNYGQIPWRLGISRFSILDTRYSSRIEHRDSSIMSALVSSLIRLSTALLVSRQGRTSCGTAILAVFTPQDAFRRGWKPVTPAGPTTRRNKPVCRRGCCRDCITKVSATAGTRTQP